MGWCRPRPRKTSRWKIMKSFKEYLEEKLGYNGSYQDRSKFDGKEFDRKKEMQTLNKIRKSLEQVDKAHAQLQYPHVVDTVTHIWQHINNAYIGINKYLDNIKDGKYDGKIDMDD